MGYLPDESLRPVATPSYSQLSSCCRRVTGEAYLPLSARAFLLRPLACTMPAAMASCSAAASRCLAFLAMPWPILADVRGALSAEAPRRASMEAFQALAERLSRAEAPEQDKAVQD